MTAVSCDPLSSPLLLVIFISKEVRIICDCFFIVFNHYCLVFLYVLYFVFLWASWYLSRCICLLRSAVAEQLKLGKPVTPEYFDEVTIYFSEIMAFIDLASESTPMEVRQYHWNSCHEKQLISFCKVSMRLLVAQSQRSQTDSCLYARAMTQHCQLASFSLASRSVQLQ